MEAFGSTMESVDDGVGRLNTARRLRAPLMGRSVLSASSFDDRDNFGYLNQESSSSNDDDGILIFNKRRIGIPLLGRRSWIPKKRRGPLFG